MNHSTHPITTDLKKSESELKRLFVKCDDVKFRKMKIGINKKRECLIVFIEVNVTNMMLEQSALGRLMAYLEQLPEEEIPQALQENAAGISDTQVYPDIEMATAGLLAGNAVLFVDGFAGAIKISDKGYPGMSVQKTGTEKVVRGSDESFTESEKLNTALIRKRLRSARLKVEELQVGIRSHTNVAIVYMSDLAEPGLVEEIRCI